MNNREKLQSLAEQRSTQRQIDSARREQEKAVERSNDSVRTAELVEFFADDVTGFRLIETNHEIRTQLVDQCPEYGLFNDGVPYLQFSIRDDEAPGQSIPVLVVRFRCGKYKYWTMRRNAELATLDELRDVIHGEVADMDEFYARTAVAFSGAAIDEDDEFDDDFDDDYLDDDDFDDEVSGLPQTLCQ